MISFNLRCDKDHEFEGWFQDSAAFARQRDAGEIPCPICGSLHVEKALSAPNIASARQQEAAQIARKQAKDAKVALAKLRQHIEKTADNVGEKFPEEARKIHYGETDARDIYGIATRDEAKDLTEEGITVLPLPFGPETQEN